MRALALVLILSACAVGPDYQRPELDLPVSFTAGVAEPVRAGPWWKGFEDPVLNELAGRALSENLSIAAAEARLRRANTFVTAERSDLFPTIDGFIDGSAADGASPQGSVGLSGVVVPDILGGRRRELEAVRASSLASRLLLDDTRRITAASLASSYVELRRTDARLALLAESLDLQQQTLRIVRLRAEAGLAADLDVQRAASDLAQTRAQQGPLNASRQQADYRISLLLAEAPGTASISAFQDAAVPSFKSNVGAGLPTDLLRARPDVAAAEADLARATALIGAEVADLLPQLRLTGAISTRIDGSDLAGQAVNRAAAVLDVPLLDFGRRQAEVRASRAARDEALANYRLALLSAIADVENALAGIEAAEARRADLAEAVTASTRAFDQLQALYKEGLATLIDVLDAQRQLIAGRERFTDSEAALAQAYVNLHAALGASLEEA